MHKLGFYKAQLGENEVPWRAAWQNMHVSWHASFQGLIIDCLHCADLCSSFSVRRFARHSPTACLAPNPGQLEYKLFGAVTQSRVTRQLVQLERHRTRGAFAENNRRYVVGVISNNVGLPQFMDYTIQLAAHRPITGMMVYSVVSNSHVGGNDSSVWNWTFWSQCRQTGTPSMHIWFQTLQPNEYSLSLSLGCAPSRMGKNHNCSLTWLFRKLKSTNLYIYRTWISS
jgi:hypothetical protein